MLGKIIRIRSVNENWLNAYLATPSTPQGPGILLMNELFRVNTWIRETAEQFSNQGYLVCVPDLLGSSLADTNAKISIHHGVQQEYSYWNKRNQDIAIETINRFSDALKEHPHCNGKIAGVGFSMGGTVTFLAAARLNLDGAIAYYASHIQDHLGEGKNIHCQTLLHMGKFDPNISDEVNQRIHRALVGKYNIALYKYDAGHDFANSDKPSTFQDEATILAHKRSFELLDSLK